MFRQSKVLFTVTQVEHGIPIVTKPVAHSCMMAIRCRQKPLGDIISLDAEGTDYKVWTYTWSNMQTKNISFVPGPIQCASLEPIFRKRLAESSLAGKDIDEMVLPRRVDERLTEPQIKKL